MLLWGSPRCSSQSGGKYRKMDETVNTVTIIGNHTPRQCGIATFTADLRNAVAAHMAGPVRVVALSDTPEGYHYPDSVWLDLAQHDRAQYRRVAEMLNMRQIDVVCVQHEFGIFGGEAGAYLLDLLRRLHMPVVTTLHTVLREPSPQQRRVLEGIAAVSDRVVVMSERAIDFLESIYGVPSERIRMIPHGIPDLPFADSSYWKPALGAEGRKVLLTFGLLSPAKGIQYMIEALPEVCSQHPDLLYLIVGATHPNLKREQGEQYRERLVERTHELGLEENVRFVDRFLELDELADYLCAADAYVTPYVNEAQITSGTLAYALGAGKAVVSTPYWYAQELLADGRGLLVPFRDCRALAQAVTRLFADDQERNQMRRRAYDYTRPMVWERVGQAYLEVFAEARAERRRLPRTINGSARWLTEPPPLNLQHLRRLTDDTGIIQHASFSIPDRSHGYCTDDAARALTVVLEAERDSQVPLGTEDLQHRYLAFLWHAFDWDRCRFRNFMSYDRRWQEEVGSEDAHGRATRAIGATAMLSDDAELIALACALMDRALPPMLEFTSPRSHAGGVLGATCYLSRFPNDRPARRAQAELAEKLMQRHRDACDADWLWFEDYLTYDNGRIPEALLYAGRDLQRQDMIDTALRSLRWLLERQTTDEGYLAPVGCNGWHRRGEECSLFDQQPLEAASLARAATAAFEVTGDEQWLEWVLVCWEWFTGRNSLGMSLYDPATGACYDGLRPDGLNRNQGAESTISALSTLILRHRVDEAVQPRLDLAGESVAAQ
ncbi:MAG: glycosyltransferase [Armatimonadota bacterium]